MSFPFSVSEPYEFNGQTIVEINDGRTKWAMQAFLKDELPKIYNMEVRKDDIWLLGYPKSGNTWVSEMIYTICLGTEKAKEKGHFERWGFPEMTAYQRNGLRSLSKDEAEQYTVIDFFQRAADMPSPRFIRTHLPLSLLPPKLLDTCKVVYISRNLKDCALSFYRMVGGTALDDNRGFEGFIDDFVSDKGRTSPACLIIRQAWELRHHPNMLFLFYEDLRKDLGSQMKKTAIFLGKTLTEETQRELEQHLSMESMRGNKCINMSEFIDMGLMKKDTPFVRKGLVGGHKNYFTPEMEKKWSEWWTKHMEGSGFAAYD